MNMANETIVLPVDHFKGRIKHQYNNPSLAIVREILQNSQDAGASKVEFTFAKNEFSASDNGKGMTLDDFRSFYLTLGGSKKDSGSIGGFGAAKELLSFAWENWLCKGQGFVVTGHGASTPESRQDSSQKKGFFVGASDKELDGDKLWFELKALCELSDLSVKVFANGEEIKSGRKLRKNQEYKVYDFGTLYVHKGEPNNAESAGYLYVRTRGLFTAKVRMAGDYVYYLDLTQASSQVLTENRDGIRWNIQDRINDDIQALVKNPERVEVKSKSKITVYGSHCSTGQGWSHNGGYYDVASEDSQAWRAPFAVAEEDKPANVIGTDGLIKAKYAKALEIWTATLNLVALAAGLERFIPGLYFGTVAIAIHSKLADKEMIAIDPETVLTSDAFSILELAMHEVAHHFRSDHSQEFESARMNIARQVGSKAAGIMHTISTIQAQPARKGAYWAA
jgi:hypothetical protein